MKLYGIPNCDTVRKARRWLNEQGRAHDFHDYRKHGLERAMLERWADAVGWEKLLNRSGTTFRKVPEEQRTELRRDTAIDLMLVHPAMIRRPVLEGEGVLLIGFSAESYAERLG